MSLIINAYRSSSVRFSSSGLVRTFAPLFLKELLAFCRTIEIRKVLETMFVYNSPIGLMIIKYNKAKNKYLLTINDICYEEHDSPQSAADNVLMHVTGCYEWDVLDDIDAPSDISEWNMVK